MVLFGTIRGRSEWSGSNDCVTAYCVLQGREAETDGVIFFLMSFVHGFWTAFEAVCFANVPFQFIALFFVGGENALFLPRLHCAGESVLFRELQFS